MLSYNNLAAVLGEQNRHVEAVATCRDAARLAPDFGPLYCNLARSLQQLGRVDEAIAAAERAIELCPDSAAYCNLGMCYLERGQLDEAIAAYRRGLELNPADFQLHSNLVYALNYHPGHAPQAVWQEHRQWGLRHADPLLPANPRYDNDRAAGRRLRIGYVSAHFRAHAVAAFTESMLAAHNHAGFEIFCYSNFPLVDDTTRRFQASADHWRDILALGDDEACGVVRQDQIDILVDLAGHINGNRLLLFARKPAPIQLTYLGYQNTTGMAAFDYRLTDDHADPPGTTDAYYTEKLVRLPRSFFCYLPDRQAPPPGPLGALDRGYVTFGSFNQFSKVTPQVLETWARLLAAVPRSRLILLSRFSPWLEARVAALFERHGVDPARVELAPRRAHHEYLKLITTADIALDSFPFNGHTTNCDCLWQGVPVVTMLGRMYASRFGSTAHVNLRLEELIADSPGRYIEIASALAADLSRLSELRAALRARMLDSPLLDAQGFTRNLEAAYREMWDRWCASGA
jgi:predicted O-linked N-acetylglucosamine transferase (SPINDLY family)